MNVSIEKSLYEAAESDLESLDSALNKIFPRQMKHIFRKLKSQKKSKCKDRYLGQSGIVGQDLKLAQIFMPPPSKNLEKVPAPVKLDYFKKIKSVEGNLKPYFAALVPDVDRFYQMRQKGFSVNKC
jgi:hypothetical protein